MKRNPLHEINNLKDYEKFDTVLTLSWDTWALTADWHCPFVNLQLFKVFIKRALQNKIKKLLIAGDFFDLNAFSSFFQFTKTKWAEEKAFARDVIGILKGTFKEIYFIASNHEARYLRAFAEGRRGGEPEDIFELINVDTSWITWKNKARVGNWMVVHPKHARRLQLSLARAISPQYPGMNIACAHGHLQGITTTEDGKHWLLDIGMMGDPHKIEYVNIVQTAHQKWVSGAAFMYGDDPPDILWGNRL